MERIKINDIPLDLFLKYFDENTVDTSDLTLVTENLTMKFHKFSYQRTALYSPNYSFESGELEIIHPSLNESNISDSHEFTSVDTQLYLGPAGYTYYPYSILFKNLDETVTKLILGSISNNIIHDALGHNIASENYNETNEVYAGYNIKLFKNIVYTNDFITYASTAETVDETTFSCYGYIENKPVTKGKIKNGSFVYTDKYGITSYSQTEVSNLSRHTSAIRKSYFGYKNLDELFTLAVPKQTLGKINNTYTYWREYEKKRSFIKLSASDDQTNYPFLGVVNAIEADKFKTFSEVPEINNDTIKYKSIIELKEPYVFSKPLPFTYNAITQTGTVYILDNSVEADVAVRNGGFVVFKPLKVSFPVNGINISPNVLTGLFSINTTIESPYGGNQLSEIFNEKELRSLKQSRNLSYNDKISSVEPTVRNTRSININTPSIYQVPTNGPIDITYNNMKFHDITYHKTDMLAKEKDTDKLNLIEIVSANQIRKKEETLSGKVYGLKTENTFILLRLPKSLFDKLLVSKFGQNLSNKKQILNVILNIGTKRYRIFNDNKKIRNSLYAVETESNEKFDILNNIQLINRNYVTRMDSFIKPGSYYLRIPIEPSSINYSDISDLDMIGFVKKESYNGQSVLNFSPIPSNLIGTDEDLKNLYKIKSDFSSDLPPKEKIVSIDQNYEAIIDNFKAFNDSLPDIILTADKHLLRRQKIRNIFDQSMIISVVTEYQELSDLPAGVSYSPFLQSLDMSLRNNGYIIKNYDQRRGDEIPSDVFYNNQIKAYSELMLSAISNNRSQVTNKILVGSNRLDKIYVLSKGINEFVKNDKITVSSSLNSLKPPYKSMKDCYFKVITEKTKIPESIYLVGSTDYTENTSLKVSERTPFRKILEYKKFPLDTIYEDYISDLNKLYVTPNEDTLQYFNTDISTASVLKEIPLNDKNIFTETNVNTILSFVNFLYNNDTENVQFNEYIKYLKNINRKTSQAHTIPLKLKSSTDKYVYSSFDTADSFKELIKRLNTPTNESKEYWRTL